VLMMPDYREDNPYQQLLADALESADISVVFPQGYRRIFPIFRAVREQNPSINVLHLHWVDPYLKGEHLLTKFIYCIKFLIDITLVRACGIPIVWTIHNLVSHDAKFPNLELWDLRLLAKIASICIVHNSVCVDIISKNYKLPVSKITVIPHGHYRRVYSPAIEQIEARQQLDLPINGKLYLHLGILQPYKGLENLLNVWQANQLSLSDACLMIAGRFYDQKYLETLQSLTTKTSGAILHPYFIPKESVHLYFSAADIIILPYTNILTSGSIILAMSYGKPIIAPRLGSIPETLKSADWLLYDPTNPQGLSDSLQKSLTSSLEDLGNLTIDACNRLDWESIGLKTAQCFQHSFLTKSDSKKVKPK